MNSDAQFVNIIGRPLRSEKTESVTMREQDLLVSFKSISNNVRGSTVAGESESRVNRKSLIAGAEFFRQRPNEGKRRGSLPESLRNKQCTTNEEKCWNST